jgi:hypothetical protein
MGYSGAQRPAGTAAAAHSSVDVGRSGSALNARVDAATAALQRKGMYTPLPVARRTSAVLQAHTLVSDSASARRALRGHNAFWDIRSACLLGCG